MDAESVLFLETGGVKGGERKRGKMEGLIDRQTLLLRSIDVWYKIFQNQKRKVRF